MLYVKKLHANAKVPTVAHPGEDLGYDLFALEDTIIAGPTKVRTGIAAYFCPEDREPHGLLIRDRSSMAEKNFIVTAGVVDFGYRGEISVLLNHPVSIQIQAGTKIAQAIPIPVMTHAGVFEVDILPASSRGEGGFGSSDKENHG